MSGKDDSELHRAAREGRLEDLKKLVAAGNVDLESENDFQTPLYCACAAGHAEVVQFLLSAGARITGAKMPHFDCSGIEVFTRNRSDDKWRDIIDEGDEDSYFYWDPVLLAACSHGHTAVVKVLLENGAPLHDYYEFTPLHTACSRDEGDEDLLRLLLSFGASVNVRDDNGNTPLFYAVQEGHSKIVKLLIDAGADVNTMNYEGDTPLHCAVYYSRIDTTQLLLEHGADVHALNEQGKTPLQVKYHLPPPTLIMLLLDYDAGEAQCRKPGCCCETSVMMCCYNYCRYIRSSGHFASFDECTSNFEIHLVFFEVYWIKMKVAGLMNLMPLGYDEESIPGAVDFSEQCKAELDRLATERIGETNVSYKNIWKQRPAALRMVEVLELDEIIEKFPIYSGQMRRRYVAGRQRLQFLDQANHFFSLLPLPSLLPECVDEIMSFLSKEDLQNLVSIIRTATETSNSK